MSVFNGLTANAAKFAQQGRVTQAIATASRRTGVDFSYLMGQAQIESAMNPSARATASSATGLYQFLDQSWLGVVNNHGAEYGMGWAANAIQKSPSGHYFVSDPQMRQQILDLRNHPETASAMAAELASDNRAYIEQHTGRTAEPVDLYLAHFLGAGGAAKFLNSMVSAPNMAAASLFPAAARTNPSVFYDREGNARSLAAIRASFAQKLDSGAQTAGSVTGTIDNSADYSLPAGAPTVLPADYLRIVRAQTNPAANDTLATQSMAVADPLTSADHGSDGSDDRSLLDALAARTLGHVPGQTASSQIAPRTETARLAYLMLATLGR